MLAALPLTVTSARTGAADVHHDPMGWGDVFVAENREHYQRWFTLGRSMIVLLSVLGGLTWLSGLENCSGTARASWRPSSGRSNRISSPTVRS